MKLPSAKKMFKYLDKHANLYSSLRKDESDEKDSKIKKELAAPTDKHLDKK